MNLCDCSLQAGQQHQHAEEWDEDRSHAREEEAAQPLPSPRTGAEEEEGETLTSARLRDGVPALTFSPLGAVFCAEHSGLEPQLERRELEADLSRQQPPGQLQRHGHRHALQLPALQTVQTCFGHGGQVGLLQY